ncbi:hypothetical protein Q3G72_033244 [Acer saccharum]|nr:hypothetical protein Q3G72_033244 [Acer saccharum]
MLLQQPLSILKHNVDDVNSGGRHIVDCNGLISVSRNLVMDIITLKLLRMIGLAKSSIIVVLVVVRAGTLRSPIATALDCTIPNSVFEDLLYPNLVGVAPGAASGGVGVVPQQHNMLNMDAELLRARGFMRDRIFSILLHRQSQLIDETTRMKFRDISTRLEEGLFKAAHTKEDYMNMETLEPPCLKV